MRRFICQLIYVFLPSFFFFPYLHLLSPASTSTTNYFIFPPGLFFSPFLPLFSFSLFSLSHSTYVLHTAPFHLGLSFFLYLYLSLLPPPCLFFFLVCHIYAFFLVCVNSPRLIFSHYNYDQADGQCTMANGQWLMGE